MSFNKTFTGDVTNPGGGTALQLAASIAGAGLTGGGGQALAVGAGTGITVNANDISVNLTTLADSFAPADVVQNFTTSGTSNDVALNATTTILRVDTGNSDWRISGFARSGGNFDGDRIRILNASNTASQGGVLSQTGSVAANQIITPYNVDRVGMRYSAEFMYDGIDSFWRVVSELSGHQTNREVNLNAIAGAQNVVDISTLECGGRLTITAPTGAWSIDGFTAKPEGFWFVITAANTDFVGTIVNSTTATTGIRNPGFVDFTCNRQMSGIFMYGAFGGGTQWLFIPGASNAVGDHLEYSSGLITWRKSRNVCVWWEDFECTNSTSSTGPHHLGNTVWITTALSTSGLVQFISGEQNHPGIARIQTDAVDNSVYSIHRGGPDTTSTWVSGDSIREFEAIVRSNLTQTKAFMIGFTNNTADVTTTGPTDIVAFMFDSDNTALDVNIHCVVKETSAGSTPTITDSGISLASVHGSWMSLRIRQTTLGTVEFLINDSVVATNASRITDAEILNCGITVITRAASATAIDVDYVYFESQPLTRF